MHAALEFENGLVFTIVVGARTITLVATSVMVLTITLVATSVIVYLDYTYYINMIEDCVLELYILY